MGKLSTSRRSRLLSASIQRFCQKLTARFKRPGAGMSAELHSSRYILSLFDDDVSLTQWVQRKTAYAKQLGHDEDRLII